MATCMQFYTFATCAFQIIDFLLLSGLRAAHSNSSNDCSTSIPHESMLAVDFRLSDIFQREDARHHEAERCGMIKLLRTSMHEWRSLKLMHDR
jgi:hypothetical protein